MPTWGVFEPERVCLSQAGSGERGRVPRQNLHMGAEVVLLTVINLLCSTRWWGRGRPV